MKQIIDGLRYDTAKARAIGEFENLLRSAINGTVAENGVSSENATLTNLQQNQIDGNSRGWGEHIEPLTPGEAFEWAQEYLDPEIVESIFNEYLQDA
jgi:hypothetical protein